MSGAIPSLPQYASMAYSTGKALSVPLPLPFRNHNLRLNVMQHGNQDKKYMRMYRPV
jgi:hypothetical protein